MLFVCLVSVLKTRKETVLNMIIDEKNLSLISADKLNTIANKKDKSALRLYADATEIAGLSLCII